MHASDAPADPGVPYAGLTPELMLDALEGAGLRPDGRLLALNSYENRVWQLGIEDAAPVIAKFYRPGRWTDAAILEEHAFVQQLADAEIPAVPAMVLAPGEAGTLLHHAGFRFAVFPRCGGREPALDRSDTLTWLGRFIGRIHALGATQPYQARPALDLETFGIAPRDWLLASGCIPADLLPAWQSVTDLALDGVRRCYERAGEVRLLRTHGDCHRGNVLWIDEDDARGGTHARRARTSWISTTAAWRRRSRTSGCCWRATARPCRTSWPILLPAMKTSPNSSRANYGWWKRCARCGCCTTAPGWPAAGLTRPFRPRSHGSARRATGRTASWSCANR